MSQELNVILENHEFLPNVKLFKQKSVKLKHKNFIFARNGSGKSTFSELIKQQFEQTHNVQIFQGLEKYFGENDRLDSFALAVDASENEKHILIKDAEKREKETLLTNAQNQLLEPDKPDVENLFTKLKKAKKEVEIKKKEIDTFYTEIASKIKKLTNPQIAKTTYTKKDIDREIPMARQLSQEQIDNLHTTLKSDQKEAPKVSCKTVDFFDFLKTTNEVLTSKVEERTKITRLDTQDKINFAEDGLKIHAHHDDELCAFCGNLISQDTFAELESYFSADEVKELKGRITESIQKIEQQINLIDELTFSDMDYYPDYKTQAQVAFNKINNSKDEIKAFFEALKCALLDKKAKLFEQVSAIELEVPNNIEASFFNDIVEKNNRFGKNLSRQKEKAKDALRFNEIKLGLDEFQIELKKSDLMHAKEIEKQAQNSFDDMEKEKQEYDKVVKELEQAIEDLKPKAEKQAVERINEKLKTSVSWYVDYKEDEQSGYYNIADKNEKGDAFYRGVSDLSTGEKNIIAFLYFIVKLEEVNDSPRLPKIIIFDDPMNSNDDTMQYLIITELHKLYRGDYRGKYDPNKDYFVIMTHNVHFYLNVQPHGAHKDENKKTKYDKNYFYRLHKGEFQPIISEKEDFKTNYDAIWSELSELTKSNLRNSMLNSMRRIIETYLEFTNIKQADFYKGNEQYLKLFNVNSHSAIDSISADSFTETADELISLFRAIFKINGALDHFDAHWKGDKLDDEIQS